VNPIGWLCKQTPGRIEVYLDGNFEGYYAVMKTPFCEICGHPDTDTESCEETHDPDGFDKVCSLGLYYPRRYNKNDLLSNHILKLKQDRKFAIPLGVAMAITIKNQYRDLLESDIVVPVPCTNEENASRGYNQALELANVIGGQLGIPLLQALLKNKNLSLQYKDRLSRQLAVDGLYSIAETAIEIIRDKKVLLVDDVLTTGSTCSECARQLKSAGARLVNVTVAGRTY
jgi:predicted amidophosphoribosyltransferase